MLTICMLAGTYWVAALLASFSPGLGSECTKFHLAEENFRDMLDGRGHRGRRAEPLGCDLGAQFWEKWGFYKEGADINKWL